MQNFPGLSFGPGPRFEIGFGENNVHTGDENAVGIAHIFLAPPSPCRVLVAQGLHVGVVTFFIIVDRVGFVRVNRLGSSVQILKSKAIILF